MSTDYQIPDQGMSDRAKAGVSKSQQHLPGASTQKPFYGEGMHQGNTVPPNYPTMAEPAKGATPPHVLNPGQEPGHQASNPLIRKVKT